MRGKTPTPTALKLLRGNPGKRPPAPNEPKPAGWVGDPPTDVVGEGLTEWRRLQPILEGLGLLTSADRSAFVNYCRAWGRMLEAESQLAKLGLVVKAPSGYPLPNPYLSIQNKAYRQCFDFWLQYGMTPAARTRIQAEPAPGAQSKWAGLRG